MNIFEYLGLAVDHRSDSKVTQFVKHYDEVSDIHKGAEKDFVGQRKKDGVCSLTVITGCAAKIFSRTGKAFTNTGELESLIGAMRMPDGVYMGELCVDKSIASLEQLSGTTNPNRVNDLSEDQAAIIRNLQLYWFDMVSIDSFIKGSSPAAFMARHKVLVARFLNSQGLAPVQVLPYVHFPSEAAIDAWIHILVTEGEEGGVIRDANANWEAGHKGYRVMKKVRGVDYDLKCVGYEEGKGKYKGKVANLIFDWKGGKQIKCMLGKGWTHKGAENMFHDIQIQCKTFGPHSSPIGQIFQVYALEESSQGKLRLPKVGEKRHDKVEADL